MQAITTKYHGATNMRGSRVSATTASGIRLTIPYDGELDISEAHRVVALALVRQLGWSGRWEGGETKTGYAFVCVPESEVLR
jgi:hypothetical protein